MRLCPPRRWTLPGYSPVIEVCYSEKERILEIRDNGIGMNRDSLQNFLFTVAETGYQKTGERKDRRFPSIAKFGIGFVSVLTRAEQVKIETRERVLRGKTSESGRRVTLDTESQEALSDLCDCGYGTLVRLRLKDEFAVDEILAYFKTTFLYPSIPITFVNRDLLSRISKQLNQDVRKVEAASAEMVTEAELSTIRDTLTEVLKKRADVKKADEELSFSLEDVTYDCKPKRIVPQKPIKPFWFGLKEGVNAILS